MSAISTHPPTTHPPSPPPARQRAPHAGGGKRSVDMQIIAGWVEPRSRVLDLGCGRGVLLDYLRHTKDVFAVGVDMDFDKISACIRRGLTAHQADMLAFMQRFPDGYFDRVIFSRTLEELPVPGQAIAEGLRVARNVTVGFVNHAYWKNRIDGALRGRKPCNAVYTTTWYESRPTNPVTIYDFEQFCARKRIHIVRHAHLRGDWKTTCNFAPNLLAGYALYDLEKAES
ncbi:methyltransferase domain-containing protein [Opitutaceae bacterium TAV4]|nr:methyltransferase domain-containing protein [Opitutaceae bacterium TAV4]RRJ99781.1 methyltransferase domain-containing protein [Opitutaceae bacterium TAV3]